MKIVDRTANSKLYSKYLCPLMQPMLSYNHASISVEYRLKNCITTWPRHNIRNADKLEYSKRRTVR